MGCASSTNFDSYALPSEARPKAKEIAQPVPPGAQTGTLLQQRFHAQLATGGFADIPLDVLQLQLQELAAEGGPVLETYEVNLEAATDRKLGVIIEAHMVIGAITVGRLSVWNEQHRDTELEVRTGDRILVVNGVQGERRAMIAQLKKPGALKILLMRGEGVELEAEAVKPLIELPAATTLASECECAVCLLDLPAGSDAIKLCCGHVFCQPCIKDWVAKSATCPMCRVDLKAGN
jgi:hypothetical protein